MPQASPKSARAQFELQYIGLDEYRDSSGPYFVAYQGKYKRPLEGSDFYDALQRPDLASSYRSRSALKTTLSIAGPVTGLFGALYALGTFHSCASWDDSCVHTRAFVGLGILGGGLVMNLASWLISSDPISRSEARELVDQYNASLRDRLRLDDDAPSPRPPVVAAIVPIRGGAAAALAWTF